MALRIGKGVRVKTTVTIAANGFSVERFISMAAYNRIPLREISRGDDGRLTFITTPKSFKALKPFARKTGTRLRIIKKNGVGFSIAKHKHRKGLVIGLFFFIFAPCILSSFVWGVEAEGSAKYPPEDIVNYLSENGLKFGSYRYKIDTGRLERLILSHFPDVVWVSVEITGTRAIAHVAEIIPNSGDLGDGADTPADIVAKGGGVIESVYVLAGTPVVKPGDIVQKGDTLVSRELKIGTEDSGYTQAQTRAMARVWARRYYEYRFTVPLSYSVKNFTGNVRRHYSIMLFGVGFGLPRPGGLYRAYTVEGASRQLKAGEDYPLPVSIYTETFREYTAGRQSRTIEEAEQVARATTQRRILKELPNARIVSREYEFSVDGEFVNVRARITAVERIDLIME